MSTRLKKSRFNFPDSDVFDVNVGLVRQGGLCKPAATAQIWQISLSVDV